MNQVSKEAFYLSGASNTAPSGPANESDQSNFIKSFVESLTSTASSQPTTNANSSNQAALSSANSSNPALSTINSLLQSIAPVATVPDQAAPAALNDSSLNDNNPFDVTENRDYVKSSHDVEMRQLIMNVSTLPTSNSS